MTHHETRAEDGTLYVADGDGGWLEVGAFADIYDAVGGETVEVQYGEEEATYGAAWLDTDEDNVLTIDVRDTLVDMTYPTPFVEKLADRSGRERTAFFAESMERVWRSRGNLPDDENPFL